MIIETLTPNAAAFLLEAGELDTQPESRALCKLVRKAQRERGMQVWESMDVRLFVRGESVLLLAWPAEAHGFRFPDFESLLHAVLVCPDTLPSALLCLEDSWILLLRCPLGQVPLSLYEYGKEFPVSEAITLHILEHGTLLLDMDAIRLLQAHF